MKPKILFINSVCGFGSTGRIVADLSRIEDFDSLVCYGRKTDLENVNSYRFADFFDNASGAIQTILFDNNLNICSNATKRLTNKIKEFHPDIIHLHNIHGYYVNVKMLFKFLKEYDKPVVWTLHDCWSMTGYCPHFDYIGCDKYLSECKNCPHGFSYPFSIFKQRVNKEYKIKKELFNSLNNLTIVTPSKWLKSIAEKSYLKRINSIVINNGIKLGKYRSDKEKNKKFTVLAVANIWSKEKGIDDLRKLVSLLNDDIETIVVGSGSNKIIGAKALARTDNLQQLCDLYASSHLMINTTREENFPTVNIEALACGTPVVTYDTGGSPEIIDDKTGIVVEKGNYFEMADIINKQKQNYRFREEDCKQRAKEFSYEKMIERYRELYESLLAE